MAMNVSGTVQVFNSKNLGGAKVNNLNQIVQHAQNSNLASELETDKDFKYNFN